MVAKVVGIGHIDLLLQITPFAEQRQQKTGIKQQRTNPSRRRKRHATQDRPCPLPRSADFGERFDKLTARALSLSKGSRVVEGQSSRAHVEAQRWLAKVGASDSPAR